MATLVILVLLSSKVEAHPVRAVAHEEYFGYPEGSVVRNRKKSFEFKQGNEWRSNLNGHSNGVDMRGGRKGNILDDHNKKMAKNRAEMHKKWLMSHGEILKALGHH